MATLVRISRTLETTPNELLGLGTLDAPSERTRLKDRLNSAATAMDDRELEVAVIQAEAIVSARSR